MNSKNNNSSEIKSRAHKCSNCGRYEKCDYDHCLGKVPKCCICTYTEEGHNESEAIWLRGQNMIPPETSDYKYN